MEFSQFMQAVCALVFVLGLLFITLWLVKVCQQRGMSCMVGKKLLRTPKIKVLEQKRLDAKNTLALVTFEQEEILLLINNASGLIVSRKKTSDHAEEKNV